jgi:hypothetical protein
MLIKNLIINNYTNPILGCILYVLIMDIEEIKELK